MLKHWYAAHQKAVAGAVSAGITATAAAMLDGHIDGGEAITIVGAVLAAFGIVFATPKNKPTPPAA